MPKSRTVARRRATLFAASILALAVAGCQNMATHEGGTGTLGYGAVQSSANASYIAVQKTSSSIPDPYQGTWIGKAHVNGGAGSVTYARGMHGTEGAGGDGYYGAAFYFPTGTFANQDADIEIMGWEDGAGGHGGVRISSSDHLARLVRGDSETIGQPFELREGTWNWLVVRQRFSPATTNEVYLNGHRLFTSNANNDFGRLAGSVRFGLVSVGSAQSSPLDVYVDDAFVSPDQNEAPLATAAKPNILIILTDDQRLKGAGHTGTTMDVMPKTKQWFQTGGTINGQPFAGGTFYPNAVDTTPLCCPSRGSIFSGRYAHNHGIMWNPQTKEDFDRINFDQSATLQALLGQAGYRTAIFGKYFNGWGNIYDANGQIIRSGTAGPDPPQWDEWAIHEGSGVHSGFEVNENGTHKFVYEYETEYTADRAEDFLQRNQSNPWFLYLAPRVPHGEYTPAPKYVNASVPPLEKDAAFFEGDRQDKPTNIQYTYSDQDAVEFQYANHLRMLKSVDDMVDRVMTKLHALGEDDNTLAFFLSDNGFMWGQHGLKEKTRAYLESVTPPFYARWPGYIGSNQTDNRSVANIDLAPTVLDAVHAGQTAPVEDGESLLEPAQRKLNFTETAAVKAAASTCSSSDLWASLTSTTFQYTAYYSGQLSQDSDPNTPDLCVPDLNEAPVFREYYDISPGADPMQLTNLLDDGDPANDPPTAQLDELVNRYRACGPSSGQQPCHWADGWVDFLLPDTGITTRDGEDITTPSTSSGDTRPTFTFTSSVPGSFIECTLDGLPCTDSDPDPTQFTPSSALSSGNHTLSVAATAGGRTDSTPATYTWEVKPSDPETEITSKPATNSTSTTASFSFRTASSHSPTTFECQLDAGTFVACPSGQSYAVANGTHTFKVRSVFGGVADPSPAQYSWTVDATPPDTQITAGPADGATSLTSASVTFSFRTPVGGEAAGRFECKLEKDGANAQYKSCAAANDTACASNILPCSKTITGITKGSSYTFSVRAVDTFGNADPTPATRQWSVNTIQAFDSAPDATWPQITQGSVVRSVVPPPSSNPGGGWFVGGDFTEAGFPGGARSAHTDLLHINSNKTVDNAWTPSTNGTVYAMEVSGNTLYIGGSFTCVNDTSANCATGTPRNNLAAIQINPNLPGYGTPTAWNPGADGPVFALEIPFGLSVDNPTNTIYVAGAFTHIGPTARSKVAELDRSSGASTSWNPQVNAAGTVYAMTTSRRNVYVGGQFSSVGSTPRTNLAEIDRVSSQATDWNPGSPGLIRSLVATGPRAEALPTLYVGGQFDNIGSPQVARKSAAQIHLSDNGTTTAWNPSLGLGTDKATAFAVRPLLPACTTTDFQGCVVPLGGAFSSVGAQARNYLAQTDSNTGAAQDWAPAVNRGVRSISYDRNTKVLGVGGVFGGSGYPNLLAFYNPL